MNSAPRNPHPALVRGQAMIELAVFGAILIAALGLLLRYSLTAQYAQQTKMRAFRNALMIASRPSTVFGSKDHRARGPFPTGGGTALVIDERLGVDPSNPFGIGGLIPVVDSATVIRDPRMDTAESRDLQMRLELNNQVLPEFPAADFDEDMGFDQDVTTLTRTATVETVLLKQEDEHGIATASGVTWKETQPGRTFTHPGGVAGAEDRDGDGEPDGVVLRDEQSTVIWNTPWGEQ